MQRTAVFAVSFGLAALPLLAQTNAAAPRQKSTQQTLNRVVASSMNACPVSMHALQGSGTGLVAVRNAKPDNTKPGNGPTQRIHLVLGDAQSRQITDAKLKVYGLTGKNRLELASSEANFTLDRNNSGPAVQTRTLNVGFEPEDAQRSAADLVLSGFTSVTSIQLESITYKDGSTWAIGERQACQIAPDPLMLVADR